MYGATRKDKYHRKLSDGLKHMYLCCLQSSDFVLNVFYVFWFECGIRKK